MPTEKTDEKDLHELIDRISQPETTLNKLLHEIVELRKKVNVKAKEASETQPFQPSIDTKTQLTPKKALALSNGRREQSISTHEDLPGTMILKTREILERGDFSVAKLLNSELRVNPTELLLLQTPRDRKDSIFLKDKPIQVTSFSAQARTHTPGELMKYRTIMEEIEKFRDHIKALLESIEI